MSYIIFDYYTNIKLGPVQLSSKRKYKCQKNILYIQGIHAITITWGNGMIS